MEAPSYRITREIASSPLQSPNTSREILSDYEDSSAAEDAPASDGAKPAEDDACKEIGVDGRYTLTDQEGNPVIVADDDDIPADPPKEAPSTPDVPPEPPSADPLPDPATPGENSPETYTCSQCDRCFTDHPAFVRHEKLHFARLRFNCVLCGKGCGSKSDLIKHERVHTGEKPYSCALCGKCYSQKSHLYTHERIHTGEKPFSCSQCLRRFSFKSQLIRHMRNHTGADSECGPVRRKVGRPVIEKLVRHQNVAEKKTYSCTLCGKSFPLKSQLISHILNDSEDGPDSCSNRRKSVRYSLKEKLVKPKKVYSEENTYACEECGKCFTLKSQLIKHVQIHAGGDQGFGAQHGAVRSLKETVVKIENVTPEENPYACEECGKCFTSKAQLIKHVKEHAGVELNSSAEYGEGFAAEDTMVKVEIDSSEENLYSCAECEKTFTLKSQLVKHVRQHAEGGQDFSERNGGASAAETIVKLEIGPSLRKKKLHSCEECGKIFSLKSLLIKHQDDHARKVPKTYRKKILTVNGKLFKPVKGLGEKPYTCDECGKCFVSVPDLARHKRMHIRGKPFHCSFCGKGCASKSDLIKHERVHTGEKPYPCSYCGQCFSQTSHLNQHERIHTGVKPYGCLQCGKSYAFKSQLTKHERIHSEGKIYPCSKCTKIFSAEEERNQHERVHTEEKPYSCSLCGKCFHWKAAFIRHERAHAGQLPFTCTECGRGCASRYDLIKHERVHTREKPYSCSVCGKCYSQKSHLNMHVKVHTV